MNDSVDDAVPQAARNSRELAAAVGRNESTVRRWFGRKDWPFGSDGPFDVAAVIAWEQKHIGRRQWKNDRKAASPKAASAATVPAGQPAPANGKLTSVHELDLATAPRDELDRVAKHQKAMQAIEDRTRAIEQWIPREDFDRTLVSLGEMFRRDVLDLGRSFEAEYPDVQGELLPRLERMLNRIADRIEADQKRSR